jgi:hypothetical protein
MELMEPFSSFGLTHMLSFRANTLQAPSRVPTTSISPDKLFDMQVNGELATCTSMRCRNPSTAQG